MRKFYWFIFSALITLAFVGILFLEPIAQKVHEERSKSSNVKTIEHAK